MTKLPIQEQYLSEFSQEVALKEALRQTELHIDQQQRLTGSADQRAIAFSTVAIVVVGLLLTKDSVSGVTSSLPYVVVLLFLSIGFAVYSARPQRIFGSGGDLSSLSNHLQGTGKGYLIATLIERNDRNIRHNFRVLHSSAKIFRFAMFLACLAAVLLIADWLIVGQADTIGEAQ